MQASSNPKYLEFCAKIDFEIVRLRSILDVLEPGVAQIEANIMKGIAMG